MSCILQTLNGIIQDCASSKGGIKKVWITTDNPKPIIEDNIISSFNDSHTWYEYNFKKNTSFMSSTLNVDDSNGINFVSTELSLQFNKMDTVKRIEMIGLAVNDMYCIVLDNNKRYWYLGFDEPITATASTSQTGTAKSDGNFYQITLTDESKSWPYEVSEDAINNLSKNAPIKLTSLVDNNVISINYNNRDLSECNLFYSTDSKNYIKIDNNWNYTLNKGEIIYIKGNNPNGLSSDSYYYGFNIQLPTKVSGNVMSLLGEDIKEIPNDYCFNQLFFQCRGITTAPEFPSNVLTKGCYKNAFQECVLLTTMPDLPAMTLAKQCYYAMFVGCSSLKTMKPLLATKLAEECYYGMFNSCRELVNVPKILPATKLEKSCYFAMFISCINIVKAPILPAKELTESCYQMMFNECLNLKNIELYAENTATNSFRLWVDGVSTGGVFKKKTMLELPIGSNGIPTGWDVVEI